MAAEGGRGWNPWVAATVFPALVLGGQWLLWPYTQPLVWLLYLPAIYLSGRMGGVVGGLAGTAVSILLVWYAFIFPSTGGQPEISGQILSSALFLLVGCLLGESEGRLRRVGQRLKQALEDARIAGERTVVLNRRNHEQDEFRARFFTTFGRELRTPLTLILGSLGRLLADTGIDEPRRQVLVVAERNALLLSLGVNDMLEMTALDAGRVALSYGSFDLMELAHQTAAQFELLAAQRSIRLKLAGPSALPIEADPGKCRHMLLNLLANALKVTPEGREIALTLDRGDDLATIAVADGGPGFPKEMREAVFDRWRPEGIDIPPGFGGAVPGLSLVKDLAVLHGGWVGAADAPGGGALITLTLPRLAPPGVPVLAAIELGCGDLALTGVGDGSPRAPSPSAALAPAALVNAPLVLVVEDNPEMSAYLAAALAVRYRVAQAYDGDDGLAKARQLRPDLIVADALMPGLGGEQMVAKLRGDAGMDEVPVVMLTTRAGDIFQVKMLQAGVQDCLTKPFFEPELLARVDSLVAKRAATLRLRSQLAAIVEATSDAVIGVTAEGIVNAWNAGAARLFGYAAEEALGQSIRFLSPLQDDPEDMAVLAQIAAGNSVDHFETVRCRKDGGRIDVSVTVSPLRGGGQGVAGAAIIARDITKQKHEAEARRWEEISRHIVAVQEAERHALSAELHDRTSSNLAALRLTLGRVRQALATGAMAEIEQLMEDVDALVADTNQGIRGISAELRPPLLDYFGLRPALEEYARDFGRHTGLVVEVGGDYGGRLMPELELALFRIAQEALANCAKHAQAKKVVIDLSWRGEKVFLSLADDGIGFTPGNLATEGRLPGLGLLVMRERAELAGGNCKIESLPGRGTRIEVLI